jgi:hypothetical protein
MDAGHDTIPRRNGKNCRFLPHTRLEDLVHQLPRVATFKSITTRSLLPSAKQLATLEDVDLVLTQAKTAKPDEYGFTVHDECFARIIAKRRPREHQTQS